MFSEAARDGGNIILLRKRAGLLAAIKIRENFTNILQFAVFCDKIYSAKISDHKRGEINDRRPAWAKTYFKP